jgi:hypothetical protein
MLDRLQHSCHITAFIFVHPTTFDAPNSACVPRIKQPAFTFIGDRMQKLMITDSKEMQTQPRTTTLVLANIPAPIKHTTKLITLRREQ